jgi:release factor glutamine methyltransferase
VTIHEAYLHLKNKLKKIYDEKEAANISELVIEKIFNLKKVDRILNKHQIVNTAQENILNDYLQQLMNHKPVQYILQEAWFAGMKFFVDENVLIPRPETEELVEWVVQQVAGYKMQDAGFESSIHHSPLTILDIGTGSGCIAIALKKKLYAEVYAIDVSEAVLKIASFNAKNNNADINFLQADILQQPLNIQLQPFDIIVSNPPYIAQKESAEMQANVVRYEPHIALFVPDENPLLFYDAISYFALHHLKQNGELFFEINENSANEIVKLLQQKNFSSIEIKKDLQQKNRMVKAVFFK